MAKGGTRLRVLILARNYPSRVFPLLGLWVERPTVALARHVDLEVVAPVPWFPPAPRLTRLRDLTQYRDIPTSEVRHGIEVSHPRFLTGPGYRLHALEAGLYYRGVHSFVARRRRWFPFDLIHAHLSYPDGVVAERLGRAHDVPVVVTEHAPWKPWMDEFPAVRSQAVPAARRLACHVAVSEFVADTIADFTGDRRNIEVIPNGVDEAIFVPAPAGDREADKVLFVGFPRAASKGVDVLLDAMTEVVERRPSAELVIVGGALYRAAVGYMDELYERATVGPLRGHVTFLGPQKQREVARLMATSSVLVLPSRVETFGSVLVEALACGTPVVATRSGGPEGIVTEDVGRLVPVSDPKAMAAAILEVLDAPDRFRADELRAYAVERFRWASVAERVFAVYRDAVDRRVGSSAA